MIRVEILKPVVTETAKRKDGTPFEVRHHEAAIFNEGEKYPRVFRLDLQRDQKPYEVGMYELCGTFIPGDYERGAVIQQFVLKPVKV